MLFVACACHLFFSKFGGDADYFDVHFGFKVILVYVLMGWAFRCAMNAIWSFVANEFLTRVQNNKN